MLMLVLLQLGAAEGDEHVVHAQDDWRPRADCFCCLAPAPSSATTHRAKLILLSPLGLVPHSPACLEKRAALSLLWVLALTLLPADHLQAPRQWWEGTVSLLCPRAPQCWRA